MTLMTVDCFPWSPWNSALGFLLRGQLAHAFRSTSQVEPLGWQGSWLLSALIFKQNRKTQKVFRLLGESQRWIACRQLNSPTRWCGGWETEALIRKESQKAISYQSSACHQLCMITAFPCVVAFRQKGSRTQKLLLWASLSKQANRLNGLLLLSSALSQVRRWSCENSQKVRPEIRSLDQSKWAFTATHNQVNRCIAA